MSRRNLEAVIGRMMLDQQFRRLLFADPDAALEIYRLSVRERAALKSLDAEALDACGDRLGKRVTESLNMTRRRKTIDKRTEHVPAPPLDVASNRRKS